MQFWGDIIIEQPELIAELPRDAVALEWGYEADHPFPDHGRKFAASGLSFYVCPGRAGGTRSPVAPRTPIGNLATRPRAARVRRPRLPDHRLGRLRPPAAAAGQLSRLLAGAGFAWNASVAANPEAFDLAALLDVHAFRDAAGVMGSIACDLGNTYLQTGSKVANVSALFALVVFADQTLPSGQTAGITTAHLTKTLTYLDEVTQRLAEARMDRADAGLIVDELRWAKGHLLSFACHLESRVSKQGRGARMFRHSPATRASLAGQLAPLIDRHREIWLRRNRPGGLDDSAARLEQTLLLLRGTPEL